LDDLRRGLSDYFALFKDKERTEKNPKMGVRAEGRRELRTHGASHEDALKAQLDEPAHKAVVGGHLR
jgi:hypothetical protein